MSRIQYIPNRVLDTNGIADAAEVFVYQSGTDTKVDLFSDSGFTTPILNPVVVPAGAEIPIFYTSYMGDIRVRVVQSDGVIVQDDDPYSPPAGLVDVNAIRIDLASTDTGKGAGLVGFNPVSEAPAGTAAEFLQKLNQPATERFYAEDGARVQRLRDRVFGGAAADNNGTNVGSQPDWLTQFLISLGRTFGFQHVTQFAILTQERGDDTAAFIASNAILGAGKTSTINGTGNAIGVLGVGVNDNTSYSTGAWGGYFEGFQQPGALGPAYAVEFDTINRNTYVTVDPYGQQATQVVAMQIASGAEFPGTSDATAVANIQNNGARFGVGFNFGATSLRGTNGDGSGLGNAFQFARGHGMRWLSSSTEVTTGIYAIGGSGALGQSLWFDDYIASFQNTQTGKRTFAVLNVGAAGVNYLRASNSPASSPVILEPEGDDTNIGVILRPKGSEYLWFGTYTARALTPTGYITIKDAGGAVRRLLVG